MRSGFAAVCRGCGERVGAMGVCERGVQLLLTTGGAFATFALMSVAVGTDFWLYSRGTCRSKGGGGDNETIKKNEEVMTHSGLWRTCCLEGESVRSERVRPEPALARVDTAVKPPCVWPSLSRLVDHSTPIMVHSFLRVHLQSKCVHLIQHTQ